MFKEKDISSYSKGKERIPNCIEFYLDNISKFSYKIHRHIYFLETWLLSCDELGIDKYDLKSNNFIIAKEEGRLYILNKLEDEIRNFKKIHKEILKSLEGEE